MKSRLIASARVRIASAASVLAVHSIIQETQVFVELVIFRIKLVKKIGKDFI
jgi:hypothetical protein